MWEDTCNLYWEEKPEKKNKSGTLYSKYNGMDGILIKDKPGELRKLVKSSQRVIGKIFIFRRSAATQNATRHKSIPLPGREDQNEQRHSVLTSDVAKAHENKSLPVFPDKLKKNPKNSQLDGLHWEGDCFVVFFFAFRFDKFVIFPI